MNQRMHWLINGGIPCLCSLSASVFIDSFLPTEEPAKGFSEETVTKLKMHFTMYITGKKCPSLAECRKFLAMTNIKKTDKQVSHFLFDHEALITKISCFRFRTK